MFILKRFFSQKTKGSGPSALKVINSHEIIESKEIVDRLNNLRLKELKEYQRELAAARRSHANYAKTLPTRSQLESEQKRLRSEKRTATWSKYVEGLKKCWNPPVEELQATGRIPKRDEALRAEKSERGRVNLMRAMKSTVLMRRKYLNYLSTEVIPSLITADNLEAKIQEALDAPSPGRSVNLTAEGVVQIEKEVKRKLREIRVPMDEYEENEGETEKESFI